MKYVDEFRDARAARALVQAIVSELQPGRRYNLMEFCGGHTHAIARYGLKAMLPDSVHFVHGPGCPVCVLPIGRIDCAIALAQRPEVILCSYGDTLRVPASQGLSLIKAKAAGADVRMVYSSADALALARAHPEREIVFFAIGFETTTPPTALAILQAAAEGLSNFSVFCNHVLTPAAIRALLVTRDDPQFASLRLDGFIGPSHVSTIIGTRPYEFVARDYDKPLVISGFEPLDVLQSVWMLVRQLNAGQALVQNQFTRAVTRAGNLKAQGKVATVFELRETFEWRGLGEMPDSALRIRAGYRQFDAEARYGLVYREVPDNKACECSAILRGLREPRDCKVFGTVCTPETPLGSCMVSSEGACAAHYTYGRFRDIRIAPAVSPANVQPEAA
jgi:hydrogenase expression/formation protein HypD